MPETAPLLPTDAAAKPPRPSLAALRPLVPFALRYRGRIVAALLALVVASAATLAVPLAVRRMIDLGFAPQGAGLIDSYFAAMVAVVGVLALASATRYYCVTTLGERVVADLRDAVFRHLTTLDVSFFDTAQTGELLSRLTADTTQIKATFSVSVSIALRNAFLFFGAVAMMVVTAPKLSALVLAAIPIIVLPLVAAGRAVRQRSRQMQDRLADASAYAAENIAAIRTMQAFGAEQRTADRFKAAADATYLGARRTAKARAVLTFVAMLLAFSSVVGILWLGAQDVLAHRLTGGALSQFVLYAVFGAGALGQLSEVWSELSAAAGAAGRIGELLHTTAKIAPPAAPSSLPARITGEVAFEAVTFSYPTRPDDAAVRDLSFHVRPGETVAIVGPSGAGKSTVIQLLMRFYDPTQGRVLLDGVDIRSLTPADLRAHIALVPQDPVIFSGSIADNIRYGRPGASDAECRAAAQRAAVDVFVSQLPQGYETPVGERGVTLSGGQRQRLAIARAILKDAPVLLLDEATSALDAENEGLVQAALDALRRDRTTLVIAHRLATVLAADRILVLEAGHIVEEGTHASLVEHNGLYGRLARLQFDSGAAATGKAAE
jgi:ATP-binding cassette subfamily B protein